jgi:hypothetical protein
MEENTNNSNNVFTSPEFLAHSKSDTLSFCALARRHDCIETKKLLTKHKLSNSASYITTFNEYKSCVLAFYDEIKFNLECFMERKQENKELLNKINDNIKIIYETQDEKVLSEIFMLLDKFCFMSGITKLLLKQQINWLSPKEVDKHHNMW